jgi:hypothetical protein
MRGLIASLSLCRLANLVFVQGSRAPAQEGPQPGEIE